MSQAQAAATGTFGVLFALACIGTLVVVGASWTPNEPVEQDIKDTVMGAIGVAGALLAGAYIAAAVGLGSKAPWGSALAFMLHPITALTLVGIPVVIWQLVVLTRPAPQR